MWLVVTHNDELKSFWDFASTNLRRYAFRSLIQAPFWTLSLVSHVSPCTEERLHDGGDSACGPWVVVYLTVLPSLQR